MSWSNSVDAVLIAQKCSQLARESAALLTKIVTLARLTSANSATLHDKAAYISNCLHHKDYDRSLLREEVSGCLTLSRNTAQKTSLLHIEIIKLSGEKHKPWLHRAFTFKGEQIRSLATISEELHNLLMQIPSHARVDDAFYNNLTDLAKVTEINKSLAHDALKSVDLVQSQMILITRSMESQLYALGKC